MKTKHTFILFFSLFCILIFGQKTEVTKDSTKTNSWQYQPHFMIGVDLLNASTSFFSDRKLYQGFVSSQVKKNIHLVADFGYEKNKYNKNNYDAQARGAFIKLGSFYMLAWDKQNPLNGFYAGGKLAASFYKQEYHKVPIRGYAGGDFGESFPLSSQSSFWIEGVLGGRVQLFDSNFYIDVTAQPRYLIATSKQDEIFPMIVPGFGKSSSRFIIGFAWNLSYYF